MAELNSLLDVTYQRLLQGDIHRAMEDLDLGLGQLRSKGGGQQWSERARPIYLAHSLRSLLVQEPCTRHAFDKPRGYAGDACLLDYIYEARTIPNDTTDLGRSLHSWTFQTPAQVSVRAGKDDRNARTTETGAQLVFKTSCVPVSIN